MFGPSDKVVCVDDANPNPLCKFPLGYVVRGCFYYVKGVTPTGGVQIEGLPVIGFIHPFHAMKLGYSFDTRLEGDVGWKPHRFRRFEELRMDSETDDSSELELVGAGSFR
jgi:hypothetical protein